MKQRIAYVAVVTLAIVGVGCGAFETEDSGREGGQKDSDLTGTWESDCFQSDNMQPKHVIEKYAFSSLKDFDKTTILHTDNECQDEALHLRVSGTYASVGSAQAVDGGKQINLTVTEVVVEPDTKKVAKRLRNQEFCGIKKWKKGEERKVTGKECEGQTYEEGDVLKDVYKVVDEKLFVGGTLHLWGEKPDAERPSKLDRDRSFRKK